MRFKKYEQFITVGLTAFFVIAGGLLVFFLLDNLSLMEQFAKRLSRILEPFIVGAVIAYLLTPCYNMVLRNADSVLSRKLKKSWSRNIATAIAIIVSLTFAFTVIGGLCALVIPQFIAGITSISSNINVYIRQFTRWIEGLFQNYPEYVSMVEASYESLMQNLETWLTTELIPHLEEYDVSTSASSIIGNIVGGVMVAVRAAKNLVLGFIVAVYLLLSKERLTAEAKQIVYGLFSVRTGNAVVNKFRYIDRIFGGFISGKLLDSLIIGVLCFIGATILKMPYAMLLSVIIGVTNIIPFFGPFIGAVPCAVLILMYDPIKCLYFIIFVLLLQQFDGNVLGPKILGNTTGVSSLGVLFSIILFGGLFGFMGMLIGVPLFAVIESLIKDFVGYKLKKKDLSEDTSDYRNLAIIEVDEDTGEVTYPKNQDPTMK